MKRWTTFLVAPLLLTVAGCESVMPQRGTAPRRGDEVARLEAKLLELERQSRIAEVEIDRLRRQVADLEERVESAAAAKTAPAPRRPEPSIPPPVAAVPAPPAQRVEAEDLEPMPAPAQRPVASAAPQPVPSDGQELYDRGYTLYHQERYVDAEAAFHSFLQRYAASDLADNAQFWIGEARLRRGDTSGALAAFRETVERFPRGNKVPDALFRSGHCLHELGDLDGARDAWRRTIDRYPSSAAAALSEERLAALP